MEWLSHLFHMFLQLDQYLVILIQKLGPYIYVLLFLVIFLETGIILTPFLPGESLLFACGTLGAIGALNHDFLFWILAIAAILGGILNFYLGKTLGNYIINAQGFTRTKRYIARAHEFYDRYGPLTILIARLIPIVRTYAPFVAGIARMNTLLFMFYNLLGGIVWIAVFIYLGYFFGNLPFIKNNFSWFILAIILISLFPIIIEIQRYLKELRIKAASNNENQ